MNLINTSDNASNSGTCQESMIQCSTSPIPQKEDKKVSDFMDLQDKVRVRDMIRERKEKDRHSFESPTHRNPDLSLSSSVSASGRYSERFEDKDIKDKTIMT
ncbi:12331_t:CDS:2 [Entrophospora sp. SA101]|nr:12331_t:CDS:2 [Entrophospora sp. SA101]